MFGIYQVKVDAECKGSVKRTMHEVDKVEAVQRQQGKRNKRKRIGEPSGEGNRKQKPSVKSGDRLRD